MTAPDEITDPAAPPDDQIVGETSDPVDPQTPVHQLVVEHVDPDSLALFHRNPRRGNVDQLVASLAKSGQ